MSKTASISALAAVVSGAPVLAHRPAREMIDRVAARVFEVREKMSVSEWASKYRYLPQKVSAAPGLIDLDKTPYLRGPMDAFGARDVREIVWMKCVQVGGTTMADTLPLWSVEYAPGPWLWIAPNATHAGEAAKDRIEPAARMSPATRDRIGEGVTESKEDVTSKKIDFDVMRMTFAGSGTKNSTIARAIKYGVIDDFDRCEMYTHEQMLDRVSSFDEYCLISVGNPTFSDVGIAVHYERSNKQFYSVPCPHCGHKHELVWKNLRWKGGLKADPEEVRKTAWMQCPHPACKGRIENHHKPAMLRAGAWVAERPEVTSRQGFRLSSLYSPFQNFGWCAKGFLDAKGKPGYKWVNNVLGLPWKNRGKSIDIRELKALAGAAKGLKDAEGEVTGGVGGAGWCSTRVPDDCCVLCAGVDVQAEYTYVLVMGFSPFGLRSYFIDRFTMPASESVSLLSIAQHVRSRKYQRMDGRWMRILMQVWDTGHRAIDVYGVARAMAPIKSNRFVIVKGQGSLNLSRSWWESTPESANSAANAGTVETGRGGLGELRLLNVNTRAWKDKIADGVKNASRDLGVVEDKEELEKDATHNECGLSDLEADVGGGMGGEVRSVGTDEEGSDAMARSGVIAPGAGLSGGVGGMGVVMSSIFFPPDVPVDVLEHFAAEHVVEGRWVLQTPGLRNEAFDLAYYLGAACDAKGIRALTMEHLRITLTAAPTADQIKAWGVRAGPVGEPQSGRFAEQQMETKKPVRKPAPSPVGVNGSARIAAVRAAMARRRRH